MEITKTAKKEIEKELLSSNQLVLSGYNKISSEKLDKILKSQAKHLAKTFYKEVKKLEKNKLKIKSKAKPPGRPTKKKASKAAR